MNLFQPQSKVTVSQSQPRFWQYLLLAATKKLIVIQEEKRLSWLHLGGRKYILFALLMVAVNPTEAIAATYTVTNSTDTLNTSDPDYVGSLRWAIEQAENNPGADTINIATLQTITVDNQDPNIPAIANGCVNSYTPAAAFQITDDLTINGGGATIDGGRTGNVGSLSGRRIFYFTSGSSAVVNLNNLTLQNGNAAIIRSNNSRQHIANGGDPGDACSNGGMIWLENSTLNLDRVRISGGLGNDGGAINIERNGILNVSDSTFDNNFARDDGGVFDIDDQGAVFMENSTITRNQSGVNTNPQANNGGLGGTGGIARVEGILSLTYVTAAYNIAGGDGAFDIRDTSTFTLRNSLLVDNTFLLQPNTVTHCDAGTYVNDSGGNWADTNDCGTNINVDTAANIQLNNNLATNGGTTPTLALANTSSVNGIIETTDSLCPGGVGADDQRDVARAVNAGCEPGAYELQLPVPTDYGDAPSTYGDAVHNIPASPGLYLGSVAPDGEVSTRAENTSGAADGDDDDNVDDDDAFASLADVPIVGNYSLNVPLTSNLGTATLHAWIDFNQNDVFDAEEYQSAAVAQNDTSANLTWAVPTGTVVGETYARFRLTSDTSINSSTPNGIATDGEVEDYPVTLSVPIYDYGDAPDTGVGTGTGNYQTTAADNGAAQVVINTAGQILSIGDAVDTDDGFAQNADATADDTLDAADDEDGITAFPTVTNEAGESFTVAVPVRNNVSSTDAFLVGYIDFNQDGEFTGPNERSNTATISPNANGDAQTVNLTFTTPGGMTPGTTFARLRLGQVQATAEQATGAAASTDNGEIEDYQITITSTPPQSNNSTSCTSPSSLISLASNLLNSANYPLDSALQNQVPLSFYNGTMKFSASLNGIGTWAGGVQVREDTSFGDHIFVQPRDTAFYRTSGNNATYVFSFPTSITDLSMILGGLNFADGTTISASYQGNPVQITAANFSNLSTGMSLLDDDGDGQSDTVVSSNTGGGTEVTNNIYTLSVPEPIDTLTVVSGKDNSFTSTATIGFALIGYCAELDYGDALISYDDSAGGGSIDQDDAPAAHGISNTLYLGSAAGDAETAPQSSASADGDDAIIGGTDDEDGIVAFPLLRENSTSYSLTATVNNTSSSAANVYAWIDFDGDGEFDEDERASIASDAIALDGNGKVPGGTNGTVKLNWDLSNSNVDLNTGDSYVRIRVTTSDLDLDTNETTNRDDSSVGLAVDGEVEDYIMAIAPAPLCPAARADVWFANDESGSVSSAEFENALDFLYQISDGFIYDDNTGIKAGITGWTDLVNSTEIVVPITESFGDPSDSGLFSDNNIALSINSQGIRELYSSKQNSSPGTRLDYATNYLADLIMAGNGRRSNTPQVAVILTDADSSFINDPAQGGFTNWINEANQLRSEGAEIVLILIDEAKTAYDANPISKFIIDNVVGSNGKIITVPNYALAADSTQSYIESASQAICDLSIPNASDPGLLLVKRITAINPGQPGEIQFNDFVDDPNTADDNHPLWPDSDEDPSTNTNLYLRGVLNGGTIKPGDEVEYTVYFLSNGDDDARDVRICDVVPDHLTYVKDAYGLEIGISLGFNPTVVPTAPNRNLTNLLNDDEGDFYGAGTAPPSNLCKKVDENNNLVTVDGSNNDNGAIIVQPAPLLPPATSPGQPASSYGFIRFRGNVK